MQEECLKFPFPYKCHATYTLHISLTEIPRSVDDLQISLVQQINDHMVPQLIYFPDTVNTNESGFGMVQLLYSSVSPMDLTIYLWLLSKEAGDFSIKIRVKSPVAQLFNIIDVPVKRWSLKADCICQSLSSVPCPRLVYMKVPTRKEENWVRIEAQYEQCY